MSPGRRIPLLTVVVACFAALPCLTACGAKGQPTLKSFEKPPAIPAIRAVHQGGEIVLSWDTPAEKQITLQSIEVERAEAARETQAEGPKEFSVVGRLPGDALRFVDKDFRVGGRYYYRIRSTSVRKVHGDYSPVLEVLPEEPPPAPAGLRYTLGNDSIEISWDRLTGDVRYNIYRSREAGAHPGAPRNTAPLEESRFIERADTENTVFYTVRAFRLSALRDEGPLSRELRVSPAEFTPGSPSGLQSVASKDAVFLLWNGNPETWVKAYRIYRKGPSDRDQVLIGFSTTPAFRDREPLAAPALYCVRAQGPSAESRGQACVDVIPHVER